MERMLIVECLLGALCSWLATPSSDLNAFWALFSQVNRQEPREFRQVVHAGSEQLSPTQLAALRFAAQIPRNQAHFSEAKNAPRPEAIK